MVKRLCRLPASVVPLQADLTQLKGGQQSEYLLSLNIEGKPLDIRVVRRRRKTMALHVVKDETTELRTPLNCPWEDIYRFVYDRIGWVLKAEAEVALVQLPPANCYEAGGEVRFQGQQLTLKLHRSRFTVVEKVGDELHVSCPAPGKAAVVQRHVESWYRKTALAHFQDRITAINALFGDERRPGPVSLRKMKSRWGSCSSKGELCFNLNLIKEPPPQIDLVIAHELCHLRHFAHNQAFYGLLSRVMPDWQVREEKLGRVD